MFVLNIVVINPLDLGLDLPASPVVALRDVRAGIFLIVTHLAR